MTEPASTAVAEIVFAPGLFDLEAIKNAAYRLSDRLSVTIEPGDKGVVCRIAAEPSLRRPPPLAELEAAFRAEVLDHDLRLQARRETESVRNLILSLAFSRTGLQGE
jgi:His-Xaa-Ser system protein HxsD